MPKIILNPKSEIALYEQIVQQIKKLTVSGQLKEGELLPSVRSLAQQLGVSNITTRRAYLELEREGYVFTLPAKGTFISYGYAEKLREHDLLELNEALAYSASLAQKLNLSQGEFLSLATEKYLHIKNL